MWVGIAILHIDFDWVAPGSRALPGLAASGELDHGGQAGFVLTRCKVRVGELDLWDGGEVVALERWGRDRQDTLLDGEGFLHGLGTSGSGVAGGLDGDAAGTRDDRLVASDSHYVRVGGDVVDRQAIGRSGLEGLDGVTVAEGGCTLEIPGDGGLRHYGERVEGPIALILG